MLGPVDDIACQARIGPDRLALAELETGRRWSYAALDDAVARCATVLVRRFGPAQGERIAALARNRAILPILHAACARIGAIYVPLNWRLAEAECSVLIADAEPRAVLRDAELDALEADMASADRLKPTPSDPDRPSLILYTSGTSGRSKGALLTERNLDETARNFGILGRVTPASVFLADAPMFHVIGLVANLRPAWRCGAAVLVSDGFDPARTLARLGDPKLGVSHWFGVPQMAAAMRADPAFDPTKLRGLTAIFTGGAPHPAEAIRTWLADGIPIVNGFGMTETGTVFGMPIDTAQIARHTGSVGTSTAHVEARLINTDGRDVAPGTPGELILRGPNVFAGDWRREADTGAAFTADGWFRTGDIAVCDADGFFAIVDRRKDMFISGGENVYPAEIEAALSGCPGIAEAAVIGVPDPRWGEVGLLAVAPLPDARLEPEEILAWLGTRIARFKLPKHVRFVVTLPRTGSGKVQKAILRTILTQAGS